jgi:hypothetical protein
MVRKTHLTGIFPPQFDQNLVLRAKQELGGNGVPKLELGNEKRNTRNVGCVSRTISGA